jgi:hypothetical protein
MISLKNSVHSLPVPSGHIPCATALTLEQHLVESWFLWNHVKYKHNFTISIKFRHTWINSQAVDQRLRASWRRAFAPVSACFCFQALDMVTFGSQGITTCWSPIPQCGSFPVPQNQIFLKGIWRTLARMVGRQFYQNMRM